MTTTIPGLGDLDLAVWACSGGQWTDLRAAAPAQVDIFNPQQTRHPLSYKYSFFLFPERGLELGTPADESVAYRIGQCVAAFRDSQLIDEERLRTIPLAIRRLTSYLSKCYVCYITCFYSDQDGIHLPGCDPALRFVFQLSVFYPRPSVLLAELHKEISYWWRAHREEYTTFVVPSAYQVDEDEANV